jgi:hypothetical protein
VPIGGRRILLSADAEGVCRKIPTNEEYGKKHKYHGWRLIRRPANYNQIASLFRPFAGERNPGALA